MLITNLCPSRKGTCMYKYRTEEGIRKLKLREQAKVGNPIHLEKRRKRHMKDARIRLRGGARDRAMEKCINFKLKSYKDLPKVPKYCPILEIPLYVGTKTSTDNSPTLDRIDNNKGYIKENIQIISRKANQMKSNANFKEIEKLYFFMLNIRRKNVK